jgi:hypothetical protein
MGAPFDIFEDALMNVVTAMMGYDASWQPSTGGDTITGRMLLKYPTKKEDIQTVNFAHDYYMAEYKEADFSALKPATDQSSNTERLIINGTKFTILNITRKYDGKTCVAALELTP